MIRYEIIVYHTSPLVTKINEYMQQIVPEWGETNKQLITRQVFYIDGDTPLSEEQIEKIKTFKAPGVQWIDVEAIGGLYDSGP